MVLPRGAGDFYHKYRPQTFDEVVGHSTTINSLRSVSTMDAPAQAFLFSGDSGCGKTTTARIMAMALNCESKDAKGNPCTVCASCKAIMTGRMPDVVEINAADTRGIDDIRLLKEQAALSPVFSDNKVFILDEAHSLTKDAQQMLLKLLEEAPSGVYTILCSTDPQKIIPTVRNRCQSYKFPKLPVSDIRRLVSEVWGLEGLPTGGVVDSALELVVDTAAGSARAALVGLQQVYQAFASGDGSNLDNISKMLEEVSEEAVAGIEIARAIMNRASWKDVVALVKGSSYHPEAVRLSVLGYFRACLMSSDKRESADRFADVMRFFMEPFIGPKPENNLVLALYDAFNRLNSAGRSNANR